MVKEFLRANPAIVTTTVTVDKSAWPIWRPIGGGGQYRFIQDLHKAAPPPRKDRDQGSLRWWGTDLIPFVLRPENAYKRSKGAGRPEYSRHLNGGPCSQMPSLKAPAKMERHVQFITAMVGLRKRGNHQKKGINVGEKDDGGVGRKKGPPKPGGPKDSVKTTGLSAFGRQERALPGRPGSQISDSSLN